MTFKQIENINGLEKFLRGRLVKGGTLGNAVASQVANISIDSALLLPSKTGRLPEDYHQGGLGSSEDIIATLELLLSYEILIHKKQVIVDFSLAKKGDPYLEKLPVKPLFYKNEVYAFVDDMNWSSEGLKKILDVGFTAIGITCYLYSEPIQEAIIGEKIMIDSASLGEVSAVITSIFDSEAFLYWNASIAKNQK